MMSFDAAIFDIDGTLADSMGVWERIDVEFLARRGIAVPDDYARAIRSMAFNDVARYTIARFSLEETPESIAEEWREMAHVEYSANIRFKRHGREYLRELRSRRVKLAVATSLDRSLLDAVLESNGASDLFDCCCLTEEVMHGKEQPDVFLLASSKLGTPPERCVVFEDILPAVKSAKRAGMSVICVLDESSASDEAELRRCADLCIKDFTEAPLPGE